MSVVMRVLALAAVTLITAAGPRADAVRSQLGLSSDGKTWSDSIAAPLFDPGVVWVPGDTRTAYFWARNQAADPGRLTVSIESARTDALIETGDLHVSARGGGGAWTSVDSPGTHHLLQVGDLEPTDSVRVGVTVAFDPAASQQSQTAAIDLSFAVDLREESGDGDGDDDSGDGDGLPGTGGPLWWLAPAGIALAGLGTSLVLRSRRDRSDG